MITFRIIAFREAKVEPEEKLEGRLETVSLPESELTITDQPVEREPTPQGDQRARFYVTTFIETIMASLKIQGLCYGLIKN